VIADAAIELRTPYSAKYRILSSKLPGAALHQVVAEEGFFRSPDRPENLLYVDRADPARLVYEAVRTGYPVPMVPEWSGWLYRKLRREGYVHELQGSRKVLRLRLDEETLDLLISEGVSNGEISF
jgi:hypothetical protein